ncbi:MAG TPA: hypothetical protein PKX00_25345 [Opitutaceae bacterium]|nr:hypothetical protein [Opitutaceae bacterium]HRE08969.1 hypothetical protein [Opitutaceae bacterium]
MSWLQKLERRLTPLAIVNITMYIVIGQTFVYLTTMFGLLDGSRLMLVPALALQGEWWRLLTFVADPPSAHWLFIAFALYFLYLTGNALENQWGPLRFNLFLLVGYVLTVGTSFITPYAVASNLFIAGSIFLAFAHLHPNFTMYVFLVLPIQIKWLALLTWIFLAWSFFTGDLSTRLAIGSSLVNFFLFMGRDLWAGLRDSQRRVTHQTRRMVVERSGPEVRHRCLVCNRTDLSDPQLDFRYCSKCAGDQCYCPDHIRNHEHVLTEGDEKK